MSIYKKTVTTLAAIVVTAGSLAMHTAPASGQQEFTLLPCYNSNEDVDPRYWERLKIDLYGETRNERIGYLPEVQWFVMDACAEPFLNLFGEIYTPPQETIWFAVPVSQGAGKGWIHHWYAESDDCDIETYYKDWRRSKDFCDVTFDGKTYDLSNKNTGKSIRCNAKSRLNLPWAVGRTRANGQFVEVNDGSVAISILPDDDSTGSIESEGKYSARSGFDEGLRSSACFDTPTKPGKYKYKVRSGEYYGPTEATKTTYCNAFRCRTEYRPAQKGEYLTNKFERTFQVKVDTVIPKF